MGYFFFFFFLLGPELGWARALCSKCDLYIVCAGYHRSDPPHHTSHIFTMSLPDFSNAANLAKLDGYLADKSYVDG